MKFIELSGAGGFFLLRPAEPSERGPSLKISLNSGSALFERHFTLPERGVECVAQFLALAQRFEYGKFVRLDAPEVDGIVDAVHDEIDGLRIELSDGAHVLFLAPFGEGIAGEVGVFVFFADGEKKIVNRISEVEQADIRLKLELEGCGIGFG